MMTAFATLLSATLTAAEPAAARPFLKEPFVVEAHRGGAGLWPEETLFAYTECAKRFPGVVLEGDTHLTADGKVVLLHDASVNRTTNGEGLVIKKTYDDVRALDAGYRFTTDGGKTFPHRGKGLTIPLLADVLAALPNQRFHFEIKGGRALAKATIAVVKEAKAEDRVLLASIFPESMDEVRASAPEIACCFDPASGRQLVAAVRSEQWAAYRPPAEVLTAAPSMLTAMKITPEEIKAIRSKGVKLQFFTINDPAKMRQLLDLGADSILTDRPDLLVEVIKGR